MKMEEYDITKMGLTDEQLATLQAAMARPVGEAMALGREFVEILGDKHDNLAASMVVQAYLAAAARLYGGICFAHDLTCMSPLEWNAFTATAFNGEQVLYVSNFTGIGQTKN